MPKARDFVNRRDAKPQSANDADFEALFARHAAPRNVQADDLPIERITPNPFQARRAFDGIEDLAQAIRVQGFTSRLRVRRDPADPTMFQLVYGERRLRAASAAGLVTVPCDIAEHSDADLIEIGLAENIQRQDLDPIEEAQALRRFLDQRGYTISRLAERLGKDRGYVESRLALLRTPSDVQAMVIQRRDTVRVAREIAKLPSAAARQPLIDGVIKGELSTSDIRAIVRSPEQAIGDVTGQQVADTLSDLDRRIERNARTIASIWSQWNHELHDLSSLQRRKIAEHLNAQQAQLEQLVGALDALERRNR